MNEKFEENMQTKISGSIGVFERNGGHTPLAPPGCHAVCMGSPVKTAKQAWKTNRRRREFLNSRTILASVVPRCVDSKPGMSQEQAVDIYWPLYWKTTARTNHLSPYRAENGKVLYTVFTRAWWKLPCGTRRWRAKGRRDYVIRLGDLIEGWDLCSARAEHWCYRGQSGEWR